ncbi:MAG: orotate phosphoribosyltransferase [Chlamydiae bacterium CG10_big_fil_rev_8_21_14_0_10_35_9]|nr:MAG: orotate phosphoribosyltransferase [Chlamydiae bacterium CG10_big_fil_rev_8_21_14_0_10_35_9]
MQLIDCFYDLGIIKFGSFELKSKIVSPFYLDLRESISYPEVLINIAIAVETKVKNLTFDSVLGVPYTGIPIASAFSILFKKPLLLMRKERKTYGTKKLLEGVYKKGSNVLIIEDITTTGSSVKETVLAARKEGLAVTHVISLIDREQGAQDALKKENCQLTSLFSIHQILSQLMNAKKISQEHYESAINFLRKPL